MVSICGAGDEEGCFAIGPGFEEGGRAEEGSFGIVEGVAVVEDEVVFDAEFFEEPKDTLGLGVLGSQLSYDRRNGEGD